MNIRLGDSTLGLPLADFTKGAAHVALKQNNPLHFDESGIMLKNKPEDQQQSFANLLAAALGDVSSAQRSADDLAAAAIVNPDSVNAHDVTIAIAKANMSLSIAKSVIDKSISSFKEILNQR